MKSFKFRISLWASILALVLVVGVGATVALMSAGSNSVTNQFTVAAIDTEIEETLTDGSKEVSIKNHGPSDGYVRARIMVSGVKAGEHPFAPDSMVQWVTEEKTPQELGDAKNKVYIVFAENPFADPAVLEKGQWVYSGPSMVTANYFDGWFYYYDVLKADGKTQNLIEKVQLSNDLANDTEFLKDFSVTIYHESVVAINQNWTDNSIDNLNLIMNSFLDTNPTP